MMTQSVTVYPHRGTMIHTVKLHDALAVTAHNALGQDEILYIHPLSAGQIAGSSAHLGHEWQLTAPVMGNSDGGKAR